MPHDPHERSHARERADSGERLQKALAHLGLGSRRDVEAWIRAGRLSVNGEPAALGTRVGESDRIRLDGRLVRRRPPALQQVLLCHRSPGERLDRRPGAALPELAAPQPAVPGRSAASGRPAASGRLAATDRTPLFERLPHVAGRRFIAVSPMPQQDGGLELVTSDGELAERLQRAVRGLVAEFSVRIRGELGEAQLQGVLEGVLDHGARLEVVACAPSGGEGANRWYSLTARGASGKDVRRLFERTGALVSRVLRTRLGSAALDRSLARGRFRKLRPEELEGLLGGDVSTRRSAASPLTERRSSGR